MSRRNFFQLTLSLLNVSKKIILKTNKLDSDFQLWTWGPRGPHNLRHQILEIPSVSRVRNAVRCRGTCLQGVLLKSFFSPNSWSCLQDYRGAGRRQKSPLDGATDFLSTICQHITTVSFVSALIFVLLRKPENASKRVWIGPKHNLVNCKSL